MNKKLLLLLGISGILNIENAWAMDAKYLGLGNGPTPSARQLSRVFPSHDDIVRQELSLIDNIENGGKSEFKQFKNCLNGALSSLVQFHELYTTHYRDGSLMDETRIAGFRLIYNVSSRLFSSLYRVNARFLKEHGKGYQDYAYDIFSQIVKMDIFCSEQMTTIPEIMLVGLGLNIHLAYYNFLNDLASLLGSYSDRLKPGDQVNKYRQFSAKWLEQSKDAYPLSLDLKKFIDSQLDKIDKSQRSHALVRREEGRNAKLHSKIELVKRKGKFEDFGNLLEVVQKTHTAKGVFDPSLSFREVINIKNLVSTEYELSKDLMQLLEGHRRAYGVLLQLEQGIAAEKLKLSCDMQGWTVEDYKNIYAELSKVIPWTELKARLPEFLIFSVNCGDPKSTEMRFSMFARMLGGSIDNIEAIPHVIRTHFATFKYLQGEPQLWDVLMQKEEQEREKKRLARQRKQGRKVAETIEYAKEVKSELSRAKEKEDQARAEALEAAKAQAPEAQQQILGQSEEEGAVATVVEPYVLKDETTGDIKKKAKDALAKEAAKLNKKEEKNHAIDEAKVVERAPAVQKASSAIKSLFERPEITKTTLKYYQNLYSLAPKLTTEDAIALLEGFGLKIGGGKGSHTKLTLNAGETITNGQGKVVWHCPDLQELMTTVPRWSGKDIPDYMIKNLRYILEKIGIKSNSY